MTSFLYSVIAAEGTDLLADDFFHLRLSIFRYGQALARVGIGLPKAANGAVTHVLVNDPTTGYGIFIENMLDAAA